MLYNPVLAFSPNIFLLTLFTAKYSLQSLRKYSYELQMKHLFLLLANLNTVDLEIHTIYIGQIYGIAVMVS